MTDFSPREIVSELDRYIVGQNDAKRAVAIALRNRWRRQQLDDKLREEVLPKNILMIGPTGVGKTEISRRLAKLAGAPFLKVEATKFTEVGYVGRDVEQIVRDLVEIGIALMREQQAQGRAGARPSRPPRSACSTRWSGAGASPATRESFRKQLRAGELNDKEIEIEVQATGRRHADVRHSRHAGRADGRHLDRRHFRQARRRPHQDTARHGAGFARHPGQRGKPTSCSTTTSSRRKRSARSSRTASSSSTRSTRSARARAATAPTCRARACSAICCR